jgi:hypothetical protein
MHNKIAHSIRARRRFGYSIESIASEFRVTEDEVRIALGLPVHVEGKRTRKHYAIVHCTSGRVLWCGCSHGTAMGRWEPGTCYGFGASKELAVENAQQHVSRYAPLVKRSEAEQLHREKMRTRAYPFLLGIYG